MRCWMRQTALAIIVAMVAGVTALADDRPGAPARTTTPGQAAAPASAGQAATPPATYSLTLRISPASLWSAASDLAQQLRTSGVVGLPLLKELAGAMSAEVAVEKGAAPGAISSQEPFRMSSSAWFGGGKSAPAAAGVDANRVREVATSFAQWHAAALRSGCDALASGHAQQTLATITQQLQFVTGSTGTLGSSLSQLRALLDQSRDKTRPDPAACAGLEASLRQTISRAEALSR